MMTLSSDEPSESALRMLVVVIGKLSTVQYLRFSVIVQWDATELPDYSHSSIR